VEKTENLRGLKLCKKCGIQLSEIGIRTKPKIYCPICKEVSKMEAMISWRTKNGH